MEKDNDKDNKLKGVESIGNNDRMRFRNSQDPLYVAYDFVEKQPLSTIFKGFVRDNIINIKNFFAQFRKK